MVAEYACPMHRWHRVVNSDAISFTLRFHQQFADTFKFERLEGCAHVARRLRVGHVRIKERIHPEDIRVQDVVNRRLPDGVLHRGTVRAVARPESDHGVGLGEGTVHVPLVSAVV